MERLRELDGEHLRYESSKPGPAGTGAAPILTPLELLDRIAPWCRHRASTATATSRAGASLTPRAAVTTLAVAATTPAARTTAQPIRRRTGPPPRRPLCLGAVARPHRRSIPTRVSDLWRRDAHPRLHPRRAPTVRAILAHLGEPTAPPRIPPARGPPLWEAADVEKDSPPDPALQPAPAYEFDQRLTG
jgi:hypothetical protein